jgi:hypothetical protein
MVKAHKTLIGNPVRKRPLENLLLDLRIILQ